MLDIDKLLVEHEGYTACGENLEYDPLIVEVREVIQGKPEQQLGEGFIEGVEPDWKLVKKNCLELCGKTHSLEVVICLTQALMNLEGYSGLADGSKLLEGTIEKYWGCLHPEIDPDDNDPIERLNMLALFDGFNFLMSLQKIELISSKGVGSVSLYDIRKSTTSNGEGGGIDSKLIEAIFKSSGSEEKEQVYADLEQCVSSFQNIIRLLQEEENVGVSNAPSFTELLKIFNESKVAIGAHLIHADNSSNMIDVNNDTAQFNQESLSPAATVSPAGIHNRGDVISSIEKIEDYYHKNEPGSPIPLLLQRAKNLVDKDFIALMKDLSPDSINQLEMILGRSQSNDNDEN